MEFNNLTIKEIKHAVKMYYSKIRNKTPFEIIMDEIHNIDNCDEDDNCKLGKCETCKLIKNIKDFKTGWENPNKNKKYEYAPCATAFFNKKYYKASGNTIILEFDDK